MGSQTNRLASITNDRISASRAPRELVSRAPGLMATVDEDQGVNQLRWVSGVGSPGCGAVAGQALNGADGFG
jgi:hypothetical protein